MLNKSIQLKRRYQWATFRQLIADRYFISRVGILDQIIDTVWVEIAWVCINSLAHIMGV